MPKQPAFPGLRDAMKKEANTARIVSSRDECGGALGSPDGAGRDALPQGETKGWPSADASGNDVAGLLPSDLVCAERPMAEETLYDSEAMRRFAGIEQGDDGNPDKTTLLKFRHLLERHGLTEAVFAGVNAHLADK